MNTAKRQINDLVIGGIRVEDAEDCKDMTRHFLMNKLNIIVTGATLFAFHLVVLL